MEKMRLIFVLASLVVTLSSCAFLKRDGTRPVRLKTFYQNGKLRTDFYASKQQIDSVVLYDSLGKIQAKSVFALDSLFEMDYFKCDSNEFKNIDMIKLNAKLDANMDKFGAISKIEKCDASADFQFWINQKGQIEHAILYNKYFISDASVNKMMVEAESWELGEVNVSRGLIVRKRLNINCLK